MLLLIFGLSGAYSWVTCAIITVATLGSIGFAINDFFLKSKSPNRK
jgi:hypothetical protein